MDSRLLWGTVDMLILDVVSRGATYGYQIAQSVLSQSKGYFELKEGSLYPALHRLEDRGWIASFWGTSENNRRARYYRLTPAGRRQLVQQESRWDALVAAVNRIVKPATE